MGPFQVFVSGVVTIVVYALILAGVIKVFQIATNLSEIKDLLQDIKRNTQDLTFPDPVRAAAPAQPSANLSLAFEGESELHRLPVPAAVDPES